MTNLAIRKITEEEHQELLTYLEEIISIATQEKGYYGYEHFMGTPSLKIINDTFSELVVDDVIEAGI